MAARAGRGGGGDDGSGLILLLLDMLLQKKTMSAFRTKIKQNTVA